MTEISTAMNYLRRTAQLGTAMLTEMVKDGNDPDEIKILEHIYLGDTNGQGGCKYWQGVLSALEMNSKGRPGTSKSEVEAVKMFIDKVLPEIPLFDIPNVCLTKVRELLARELDQEFASNVIGRVGLLVAKVLEQDKTLEEEIAKLEKEQNAIIKFHRLNSLLKIENRFKWFPLSSVKDCFITITEVGLYNALKKNPPMAALIKEIGAPCKEPSAAIESYLVNNPGMLIINLGKLIVQLFGLQIPRKHALFASGDEHRFVLCNTLKTDGLELHLHALDTSRKKTTTSNAVKNSSLLTAAKAPQAKKYASHGKPHVPNGKSNSRRR
jgi:hypothetical protein